jgi:threonine aldolase
MTLSLVAWSMRELVTSGRSLDEHAGATVLPMMSTTAMLMTMPIALGATRLDTAVERLRKRFPLNTWDERAGEVRWMCSFDTTEADVDAFAHEMAA